MTGERGSANRGHAETGCGSHQIHPALWLAVNHRSHPSRQINSEHRAIIRTAAADGRPIERAARQD